VLDPAADPVSRPLDWLGRQVQEDLLLLDGTPGAGTPLFAGHLCFPGSWCLDDKMGKSFLAIHHEVPQFADRIGWTADMVMQRLKAGRPIGRVNWNVVATDRLSCAPITLPEWVHQRRGITMLNAGERCYLRLEYQTMSRLPTTGGILFTIHTTIRSVAQVTETPERLRRFTNVIKGIPRPTREYKNMTFFIDPLVDYLEQRCRDTAEQTGTTAHRLVREHAVATEVERTPPTAPYYLSAGTPATWEPYAFGTTQTLAGNPNARIRWLRRNGAKESLYLAGIVEVQPSRLRRVGLGNETCQVIAGHVTVTGEDGNTIAASPGDLLSFAPDTVWTWEITELLRYSFVITQ
jgi:uncharacterized cupin superfamily protein